MDEREKNRLRAAEYRRKNPDKIREIRRRANAKARKNPEWVDATRVRQAEYRAGNREVLRDKERQRRFGITRYDYAEMFRLQNGVCAICSQPETATRNGRVKALAVDHDHSTGKVRGLLCADCNTGIGKLKEDRNTFLSAIKYLDLHSETQKNVVKVFLVQGEI